MPDTTTLAFSEARRGFPDCRPSPICEARPVCPACGGLECLCRPRFFAGQLLTEEDLNRLDHYIVAKNRLHNRHLFGSGVACGLEMVCGPDAGTVVVKAGYALSPCGNDIVVCHDERVDICELIDRCRPRRDDDCVQPVDRGERDPAGVRIPGANQDDDEEWVLAICYRETSSRGITALRGAACSCGGHSGHTGHGTHGAHGGCGCGGGGGGTTTRTVTSTSRTSGCGCGGSGGTTATATVAMRPAAKPGPTPPHCEPTLTCEGYTFAVYKTPAPAQLARDPGALIKRFICCFQPLIEQLTTLPGPNSTPQDRQEWLQSLHATVREFLITEGLYDCELAARLATVTVPTANADAAGYLNKWQPATLNILEILAMVLQKCLCAALLPPCPPPEMNDCVPIGTVTVARGTCRVKRVCNIGSRRFLITWPTLEYWFSWLPLFTSWQAGDSTFRTLLERLCCTPIRRRFDFANASAVNLAQPARQPGMVSALRAREVAAESRTLHPLTELLAEAFSKGPKANAATVLLGAMGARSADGSALVSETALAHPGEAMLLHQVVGPALEPLLPLLGGRATHAVDTEALERAIADLRETVGNQQSQIKDLQDRLG